MAVPVWRRYARMFGFDVKGDVDDELQFHLESKTEALIAQGWAADDARVEARRQFGNIREVRRKGERLQMEMERTREYRNYWSAFALDFRYILRTLGKDRGFAIVTVLILALGIAANTAVFSVVNTVLLRPLPFPDSERLVWLTGGRQTLAARPELSGLSLVTYTVGMFEEYQRRNQSFQQLTSYNPFFGNSEYTMTGRFQPQAVDGVMVAGNFFPTLGVQPLFGRLFTSEECHKGGPSAMLMSYAFWQRQFGGERSVIGQSVTLGKQQVTIVGVLPESFDFGSVFAPGQKFDLFVPAILEDMRNWGNTLAVVGRLKPGLSLAQAQSEADSLIPRAQAAIGQKWGDYSTTMTGLKEFVSGKLRRALLVLWGAVGLILLIVCVNLSNLLLARSAARGREFALRTALGAGRGRLFRQMLTESAVLSAAGAVLGLVLAYGLTSYLARQGSIALPLLSSIAIDRDVLLWTVLVAAGAAILFGFAPGIRASAANIQEALKDSSQGMSSGRKHQKLRNILVVSEVALACVLLVGAGLLMRSFLKVLDVDLGFRPSGAMVVKVDYGEDRTRRGTILREMLRRIHEIPGVESAGISDTLPLGRNRSWDLRAKDQVYAKDEFTAALVRMVTPGYLDAMGMQRRSGRDFTWQDTSTSEAVVIINEAAAKNFWKGQDPLGRMAIVNGRDVRVIAILADVRHSSLESTAGPEMYLPVTQASPEGAELVLRSRLPAETLAPTVLRTLRELNPAQPATELRPLQHIVDRAVSPRRFFLWLVSGFAILGLILSCLGIYGVISYSVTQRTKEIGVRMALGASAPQVRFYVIGGAMRLALLGIALGAAGALATSHWISSLLFGTTPTDPATFTAIAVLLLAVALLAGYLPARRASRIDPMVALRSN